VNCARPTRSCARRRRILRWRSSTAGPSHDRVHRRSSRCLRGRADLPGSADRPKHLPCACGKTRRSRQICPHERGGMRPCKLISGGFGRQTSRSTAYARSGGGSGARPSPQAARLMKQMGLAGAVRGKTVKTTHSDKSAPCPLGDGKRNGRVDSSGLARRSLHSNGRASNAATGTTRAYSLHRRRRRSL
jgi:hypothetical protein